MLLQHKAEICDLEQSVYYTDEIFQMVVKNLTPETIYNANQELLQSFTQAIVNYSPISVNIIDYWNKNNDLYSALYKPAYKKIKEKEEYIPSVPCFSFYGGEDDIHKGFANFGSYALNIPPDQPTGIDPYITLVPKLDEEGNPVLDDEGNPIIEEVPSAGVFGLCSLYDQFEEPQTECGFYLNNIIGLQDRLAEIFMHNVYSIADNAKHNYVFRTRLKSTLRKAGIEDAAILDNINDLFTEDRFIINGTWREKKGTEVAMRYAAKQAIDSHLQPAELNIPWKWDIQTLDPMTYSVEGSLLPSIFEVFVKPLSHPISYIYEYKMVCEETFNDYIMTKKFESASSISVITLCDSNLEPALNPLNEWDAKDEEGEYIHPYPLTPEYRGQVGRPPYKGEETFNCVQNSTGQYGRHFKIAVGLNIPETEINADLSGAASFDEEPIFESSTHEFGQLGNLSFTSFGTLEYNIEPEDVQFLVEDETIIENYVLLDRNNVIYNAAVTITGTEACAPENCHGSVSTGGCDLWDALDCEEGLRDNPNVLLYTEEGLSKDEKYFLWNYTKYVLENKNYLIKYQKPNDVHSAAETVIEYWRNGPIGYYPFAIWYNDWQASINMTDYKVWYESELSDDVGFEAETGTGRADVTNPYDGARWFGFNDDPQNTADDYPNDYLDLIPQDWQYYGDIPPGTDPAADCPTDVENVFKCDVKFPNKGFGNFPEYVEIDNLDPLYLAGNLLWHPVNVRCITNLEVYIDPIEIIENA